MLSLHTDAMLWRTVLGGTPSSHRFTRICSCSMAYWSWINVKQWCGFIACGCRDSSVVIVKFESLSGTAPSSPEIDLHYTEVVIGANIYIMLPA